MPIGVYLHKLHSDITKKKMSETHKRNGSGKWMRGRNLSEEAKEKIGIANRGSANYFFIDGRSENKSYRSWLKNKRNRMKRAAGGSHTFGEWAMLKASYSYTCLGCERVEPQIILTEDHILPLSKGGTDEIDNIQPLCKSCNSKKRNK